MGVLVATCLYLTPRFFAESHYNNKDILLFAMFVITMAAGYRFLETKKFIHLFLFSIIAACTANIKIIGILPFGILLFVYLLEIIKKKEIHKKEIMHFCASILIFLVFLMILTPAIWDGPIAYLSYLIDNAAHFNRWDNRILFQGNVYRQSVTGLPRKYVLVEYAITTPIGILVCSAMGATLLLWDFLKHPKKMLGDPKNSIPFILVTMQAAFLGYAVLSNMIIYNGWRHLYFTYVGTMMAIIYLGKKALESKYIKFKKVGIGFALLFLLGLCISGIKNHPFQYTYFNGLAGNDVTENYEIDYWCVSTYNALLELQETEETEITITSLETVTWDRLREAILLAPEDGTDIILEKKEAGWINTDYILDNPMYSKMYYEKEYAYIREEYELVVSIHAYGNEVLSIYKKRK
jgi:4-amino-4-deoxy-L-arabinose transferase-like glycosyltransferase